MVKSMRHRKQPLETIAEWFAILQVDFVAAAQAAGGDTDKLVQAFEDCKALACDNFKRLAFEMHPDRGGDEERFKELSATWTRLKAVEIRPRPKASPQPFPQVRTVVQIFTVEAGYTQTQGTGSGTPSGTTTIHW